MSELYWTSDQLADEILNGQAPTPSARPAYDLAAQTGTEWVDDRCSDYPRGLVRHFWRGPERTDDFHALNRRVVLVGDFDIADGEEPPTVQIDPTGLGDWEPVATWQPEPTRRKDGWPYTMLVWTSYDGGWPLGLAPRVRFTRRPGWLEVPAAAQAAARVVALAAVMADDMIANEELFANSTNPGNPFTRAEGLLRPYFLTEPPPPDPARR